MSSARALPLPLLLMTRPEAASRAFVATLRTCGAPPFEPVIAPLIGIEVTGPAPDLRGIRGLIFTSANGVSAWRSLGGGTSLPAFTVGRRTQDAAQAAGFSARTADGNADVLLDWLASEQPESPLLHLRGRHSRGDVAARLSAAGVETREAVIYDQPALQFPSEGRAALDGTRPVVAPLFSPRSAALLAKEPVRAPLFVAAMSDAVASAAAPLHTVRLRTAARPTGDAMCDCVTRLLREAAALEAGGGEV